MARKKSSSRRRRSSSRKPKLGTGARHRALKKKLAKRKGVRNPSALAASIGRKKYGTKRHAKMAAKGRSRAARTAAQVREPTPLKDILIAGVIVVVIVAFAVIVDQPVMRRAPH